MYIARVIGDVVSSVKYETLQSHKLLIVQQLDPDGTAVGEPLIAIDMVDSGKGDVVLIVDQGTAARQVLAMEYPTIRTLILGVVDRIDVSGGPER
jgi:microcompartment protein CcmK/EutM